MMPHDDALVGHVQLDLEQKRELARRVHWARHVTDAMRGTFPDYFDLTDVRMVLDIACGPGEWANDVAFEYPEIMVVGMDVDPAKLTYAHQEAQARSISNIAWHLMDATRPLSFPDETFDIVNGRFLHRFLATPQWPLLLKEWSRITKAGGMARLTEYDLPNTNSPAFARLKHLLLQAQDSSGHSFSPYLPQSSLTPMLGAYLQDAGFEAICHRAHVLNFSYGSPAHHGMCEYLKHLLIRLLPALLQDNIATPTALHAISADIIQECASRDFRGLWMILEIHATRKVVLDPDIV
jgi:ubiquinone/menaquinone biosynthesis C-methylase UbiE